MSRFSLPVRFFNRMRLRFSPIDYRFVIVGLAVYFALVLNWKVLGHFYQILGQLEAYDLGFAASAPCGWLNVMTITRVCCHRSQSKTR